MRANSFLGEQQDRIRQIAHKMNPTCNVVFDDGTNYVRFMIHNNSGDMLLLEHSEERTPDWWAALSDGDVQDRLSRLSNGRI